MKQQQRKPQAASLVVLAIKLSVYQQKNVHFIPVGTSN